MVDQREALAVTTDLLTPGFEPSTLGSVSSNPAFYHYAIWYLGLYMFREESVELKLVNWLGDYINDY
jgi:hypothetical protein